jgi:gluconate 2-dehydrogenase gamma chain
MSIYNSISRRRFIQISSVGAVSGSLWMACSRGGQPNSSLTPHELSLVEAVADQIIPPDQDPGGKEAGVAQFIEIQLRGPYQRFHSDYRQGLAKIEKTSTSLYQKSFLELSFSQQTELLTALEGNKLSDKIWEPGESGTFFRLICDHCMQGFYGSPRHGGNRNCASWKMLGLDYPQVAGRNVV